MMIEVFSFLYAFFGAIKIYGAAFFEWFLIIAFALMAIIKNQDFRIYIKKIFSENKLLLGLIALVLVISTYKGLKYDFRVFIYPILFISSIIVGVFIKSDFFKISKRLSLFTFIGLAFYCSVYIFMHFYDVSYEQIFFKGSSAMAFNFLLINFILYKSINFKKSNFVFFNAGYLLSSYVFGMLDSRVWLISIFIFGIFIIFDRSKFLLKSYPKFFFGIIFMFVNTQVYLFVNEQDDCAIKEAPVTYKITRPFEELGSYIQALTLNGVGPIEYQHKYSKYQDQKCVVGEEEKNKAFNGEILDTSLCSEKEFITRFTSNVPLTLYDSDRFIEPIIANYMWLQNSFSNMIFGEGLYSSKYRLSPCMNVYYKSSKKVIENNINIYRGNTLSVFLFEFGILGFLIFGYIALMHLIRVNLGEKVLVLFFYFSTAVTSVIFSGFFIIFFGYVIASVLSLNNSKNESSLK